MLLLLAMLIGFSGFMFPWAEEKLLGYGGPDAKVLDLRFGFSAADANRLFEGLGEEGRSFYQMVELTLDLVYPIVYSLFLAALLLLILRKILPENSPWRWLVLIPFATAIFDYLENLGIVLLLRRFPASGDAIAGFASFAGMGKWSLFGLSALLILGGLLLWGYKQITLKLRP